MTAGIAQHLRDAAANLQGDTVSVAGLLRAHGPATEGSLLLMLAVPCLLPVPGAGTVMGFGVLALALALWRGQSLSALPGKVAELEVSSTWARRVLATLAWVYARAAPMARARLGGVLNSPSQRGIAVGVAAMAVVIILPIPFGNVLPALSLMVIGLGLAFRDGAVILSGLLMAVATVVLKLVLLALAFDTLSAWLAQAGV